MHLAWTSNPGRLFLRRPSRTARGDVMTDYRDVDTLQISERVGIGNREALQILFARYEGRLRHVLRKQAGSLVLGRLELEDLVQEALLEATRAADSFRYRGPGSFFSWLSGVAVHRMHNLRRLEEAQRRDVRRDRSVIGCDRAAQIDPVWAGAGPRTLTAGVEEMDRVRAAMASLASADQEVIRLARFENLCLAEVGERIGRSRNAAALLLSRALRKLKARMDR